MDSKYLSEIFAGFLCMGRANAVPVIGIYYIPDIGAEFHGGFQNIAVSNKPLATTIRIESQYPSEEK